MLERAGTSLREMGLEIARSPRARGVLYLGCGEIASDLPAVRETMPELREVRQHPLGRMVQDRLSVTLCTDNRLVSDTTVRPLGRRVTRTVSGGWVKGLLSLRCGGRGRGPRPRSPCSPA